MRIKFNPRVIFEASVIALLFLTLYIERDLGIVALITIFFVKLFLSMVIIVLSIRSGRKGSLSTALAKVREFSW